MKTKANKVFFSLLGLIAVTGVNGIAIAGDISDEENAAINRQLDQEKAHQAAVAALQAALAASQAALATSQAALAASQKALAASQAALAASHRHTAASHKPAVAMETAEVAEVVTSKPAAPGIYKSSPTVSIEASEVAEVATSKPAEAAISKPAAVAMNKQTAAAAVSKPAAAVNKSADAPVAVNTLNKPAAAVVAINKPTTATNRSATGRAVSDEEDASVNRHHEQAKTQHAQVATNTSPSLHALHAPDCHMFTTAEQKTIDKGEVVLGTLQKNGHNRIRARVHISAPPQVVWETVHEERKTDPDLAYSKVLETSGQNSVLEQKFQLIPIVGSSVCVMRNTEIPGHKIDYSLMKSDRFKALEGTWIVSANPDGTTILELSSYIDMGLPVPRSMLEVVASKKLAGRLQNIRKMAEQARPHSVANKATPH